MGRRYLRGYNSAKGNECMCVPDSTHQERFSDGYDWLFAGGCLKKLPKHLLTGYSTPYPAESDLRGVLLDLEAKLYVTTHVYVKPSTHNTSLSAHV